MSFQVIPTIILRGGRLLRLRTNASNCEVVSCEDPVDVARRHADAGVGWLHVVDRDGVDARRQRSLAVIESIVRRCGLRVQSRGGVRTTDDLRRLYAAGVERVVIGELAVRNPYATAIWLAQFGAERVVLALDVHHQAGAWRLPIRDADDAASSVPLELLAAHYARAGARHVLCRDLRRPLRGGEPGPRLYRDLSAYAPDFDVQIHAGACSLEDVRTWRRAGARAVVVGGQVLGRDFTVHEALHG